MFVQEAKTQCWARRAASKAKIAQAKLEWSLFDAQPKSFKRDARDARMKDMDNQEFGSSGEAPGPSATKKSRSKVGGCNIALLKKVEKGLRATYTFAQYTVVGQEERKDIFFGNTIGQGSGHRTYLEGKQTIWETTPAPDDADIGETSFSCKVCTRSTSYFLKVHAPPAFLEYICLEFVLNLS